MKSLPTEGYTALYFSTATIKGWKNLLKPDKYKEVITNSMSFLTEEESVWNYVSSRSETLLRRCAWISSENGRYTRQV